MLYTIIYYTVLSVLIPSLKAFLIPFGSSLRISQFEGTDFSATAWAFAALALEHEARLSNSPAVRRRPCERPLRSRRQGSWTR